jgi:membrane protein DedA with SNARE-associated domain
MEMITQWVAHYGYAAVFFLLLLGIVGLPVPDEWLLAFSGYLIFKEHFRPLPAFAAASLGSMCGITVSYVLGRSFGHYILNRYGRFFRITAEDIKRVHHWFARYGTWTLLIGYFIPGVRHMTAVVAGTSRLRPLSFSLFAYSGALIWSATFIGLGYFFGNQWSQVLEQIHRHLVIVTWIALGIILIYLGWHIRKSTGRTSTP